MRSSARLNRLARLILRRPFDFAAPGKRCGKSRLLGLLAGVCSNASR
jgi:hypothetical protein